MNERIDIVFPNYNKKAYITECLNSLLAQTYSNWRCIVVDGFSDDGSWEIIQDFAQKDARFELYQLPRLGNFYKAWNFGLSKVENPYFCILTSDDLWQQQWLEKGIISLSENENAVCVAAKTEKVNANDEWTGTALYNLVGDRFFQTSMSTPQTRAGIDNAIANYFIGPIYSSIHSLLMRSKIIRLGERFAEDLGSTADYEWYIKLGLYGDIIYHPEIEVGWRVYEGQATKPRNQEENGNFIQKIHLRNRDKVAQKLEGIVDNFEAIAQDYDNRILAYHYARSYLINIVYQPVTEIPRLLKVVSTMPRELLLDCLFKIRGKNFFLEESLATARQVVRQMASTT